MKNWKGKWLMFVAAVHTAFALYAFSNSYLTIIDNGVFNSVTSAPLGLSVWFILFGVVLFILGLSVLEIDKTVNAELPKTIGLSILLLTILGVILMPASGFWLMFPPAIAMLLNKDSNPEAADT